MSAPEGNNVHVGEHGPQKPRRQRLKKKPEDGNIRGNQKNEIIDFAPPMRKGQDLSEAPAASEVKQHPHAARNASHRGGGAKELNPTRGRTRGPQQSMQGAEAHVTNTAPSFTAIPPHTVEAIAVLAQTLLPPPQMSELIRRLSSAMPKGAGAAARQVTPMGADHTNSAAYRADQPPRGGRGGRGRGGRGRGGRGGRGRGDRGRGGRA